MSVLTEAELSDRGTATLVASWQEYAGEAVGATLRRLPASRAGRLRMGPSAPSTTTPSSTANLTVAEWATAIEAMEDAYASAGITRYAAWVREHDEAMRDDLMRRGYTLSDSSLAMGMALDDIGLPAATRPGDPRLARVPARHRGGARSPQPG